MEAGALLYEGKAKRVYATDDPARVIMEFKDDATAFNGEKRGTIVDKGVVNAAITATIYQHLETSGIPTHFLADIGERRLLVRRLAMIPLEVVVRNRVAGSLAARLGLEEGSALETPVVECYYKNDALGDPLLNDDHIRVLGLAGPETVAEMRVAALRVNSVMSAFFAARDLILVDFKLEFGRVNDGIVLGDEMTPDTCRLWQRDTLEKLDKDRFRRDLGGVEEAYQEVFRRVTR